MVIGLEVLDQSGIVLLPVSALPIIEFDFSFENNFINNFKQRGAGALLTAKFSADKGLHVPLGELVVILLV